MTLFSFSMLKNEIRKNNRGYEIGDKLILNPILQDGTKFSSAKALEVEVCYIDDYEQKEDYLVLGIKKV